MDTDARAENVYTDSPRLRPNLILGSLQLLLWFLLHPSAWRNHIARIDPSLRADFCLAELGLTQWRNPALRRLLAMQYVVWPLMAGLVVGLVSVIGGSPRENVVLGIATGIGVGVGVGVGIGVAGSTVAGALTGTVLGLVLGAATAVVIGENGRIAFSVPVSVTLIVLFGMSIGAASCIAGSLVSQRVGHSPARLLSGVAIGVIVSIVAVLVAVTLVGGMPVGIAGGLALGVAAGWRTRSWTRGVSFGIILGAGGGLALDAVTAIPSIAIKGLVLGAGGGVLVSALYALPHVVAERIAGPWAGVIAGALGLGGLGALTTFGLVLSPDWTLVIVILSLVTTLLGLTLLWWRPMVFYPFEAMVNLILYRADEQRAGGPPGVTKSFYSADSGWITPSSHRHLLQWHSAFWDELQHLRLPGLDDHLVLMMEHNPDEGRVAMEYLNTSHQRWAAQAAQIELDARGLERCADVTTIGSAHRSLAAGGLEGPASALLRSFSRVSKDVKVALYQESIYNQRLALSGVEDRLDALVRELTRSGERYAARFRPIATKWRQVIAEHGQTLADAVEARQEIDNPYVIGVPLTEIQEIFVGRTDVSARIEQLLLDRRRPPLLLYGQRRMGKTSLLTNLGRLLPSTIVPLFVDLQGPATRSKDHVGFLYNIARGMANSAERQRGLVLPTLTRETLAVDPFTSFDEWLDQVEVVLEQSTALLALDEFEALDDALAKGRFSETAVLGMLRHLIQHRPRFKVLLAGSHTLDEFQRWSSYLINVQVVHIGYLRENEARQLVEQPVKEFALQYEPAASQRVLDLTRGHPALVQLLCAEIVALKNEQSPETRRLARLSDVEEAVPKALNHGSFFFTDIERNQVDAAGLTILRFLASQGERMVNDRDLLDRQFPNSDEMNRALVLLVRKELIEWVGESCQFQVELIRRWFARNGQVRRPTGS
jgi:hypothetical protein